MNRFSTIDLSFLKNRWVQYLGFWGVCFFILARYFSFDGTIQPIDIIYTQLFLASILLAVSVNTFWLIPSFLANRRYAIYGFLLIITLALATLINILTFKYVADWIFPGYYFISYYGWIDIVQFIGVFVGLTTLLQLSRSWFREAEMKQQLAEVEQSHTETELKVLRAQINPHFLFNSLNHIYALAKRQSPQTGEAVLNLSELLRYTLRNMDQLNAPLEDEIDYVRQYVELYKSRVNHPERIKLDLNSTSKCNN